GNLINALLDRYIDNKQQIDAYGPKEQRRVEDIREVARRLLRHPIELTIPTEKEDTLRTLQEDINNALSRNQPTLVLDRLHTFSTRYLRNVCSSYDIGVTNDKGNYLPLHSLAGALKKHYLKNVVFDSPFVPLAIQNSIVIFEKFNEIRNKQSYAHDNDVLGNTEAEYVVRTMINTLSFIDSIERLAKRNSHSPAQEDPGISEVDYPFRYRGQNET
ncbi:MAG: abortive infection family protein, partial [Saccharofermentanales bacterium]